MFWKAFFVSAFALKDSSEIALLAFVCLVPMTASLVIIIQTALPVANKKILESWIQAQENVCLLMATMITMSLLQLFAELTVLCVNHLPFVQSAL